MTRLAVALLLALGALACGTNKPELPPGLPEPETCVQIGYPEGPFGTEPGSVGRNACFRGWTQPDRVEPVEATLESISLGDYHDPDGTRGVRLLLVNTAALWCSACRIEHETLPEHVEELGPRGLVVLSALFQGTGGEPATFDDLVAWVETYQPNFPMLLDPDYSFGVYASAETAPLNLVIDARTMKILKKYIGDQSAVIWPFIEGELARRE